MGKNTELKAYKIIADIRGKMHDRIRQAATLQAEYGKKEEKALKLLKNIADSSKWDSCNFLSREEKSVLEVLTFIVDDEMLNIRKIM